MTRLDFRSEALRWNTGRIPDERPENWSWEFGTLKFESLKAVRRNEISNQLNIVTKWHEGPVEGAWSRSKICRKVELGFPAKLKRGAGRRGTSVLWREGRDYEEGRRPGRKTTLGCFNKGSAEGGCAWALGWAVRCAKSERSLVSELGAREPGREQKVLWSQRTVQGVMKG